MAAVPLVKLLKRKHATKLEKLLNAILEGAAKPVGGDADGTIRPAWMDDQKEDEGTKVEKKVEETVKRKVLDEGAG